MSENICTCFGKTSDAYCPKCSNLEIESESAPAGGSLDGLRYALGIVRGRRVLNRPAAYLAAISEIEIFLEAAIDRAESGEPIHSIAVVQANEKAEK